MHPYLPGLFAAGSGPLLAAAALLLLAATPADAAAAAVRTLESDAQRIVLEVVPGEPRIVTLETPDRRRYVRVEFEGLALSSETGAPELPHGGLTVAVPAGTSPRLRVLSAIWSPSQPGAIAPVPLRVGVRGEPFSPSRVEERERTESPYYGSAAQVPAQPFVLTPVRQLRHQRVVQVAYHAAVSEPFARSYRTLERAVLEVTFERDPQGRSASATSAPIVEPSLWRRMGKSVLRNADEAEGWARGGPSDAATVGDTPFGGGTQWKVEVRSTGIQEISFAALAAAGFPAGTPNEQITVYQRSFDVDAVDDGGVGAADLFSELDVPVLVRDRNANGTFDAGDGLVFHGRSFRDQWMTSGWEHEDTFSVNNYVWVRVDVGGGGARMALARPGGSLSGLPGDLLPSTPAVVRREEDIRYTPYPIDMGDGRHTFEAEFYYWNDHRILTGENGWTMTDDFVVTDLIPGSTASITARVAATGRPIFHQNSNELEFSVNSTLLGQELLSIEQNLYANGVGDPASFLHTYPIPAGVLSEGTNEFGFFGNSFIGLTTSPVRNARFLFDWYEITYDRRLRAVGGASALTTANGTAGNNVIQVQGFGSPSVLLFDVTDPAAPQQVGVSATQVVSDAGAFTLSFDHDNAGGVGSYAALGDFSIPKIASEAVVAVDPPTLLGAGVGARYVVIAHDDLMAGAERLADWRRERYTSLATSTSEVYDVFNNGMRHPKAIKAYGAYALHRWSEPLTFLCLVGDANEDHRNVGAASMPDLMPSHSLWASYEGAPEETDQYYAELTKDSEGNWDDLSDIYVGRLALNTPEEFDWNLQRMEEYESGDSFGLWRSRVLLLADDALSGDLGGGTGDGYLWKPGELEFCNRSRLIADSLLSVHPVDQILGDVFCVNDFTHPCNTDCSSPDCGIWCACLNDDWVMEYTCTRDATIAAVLPELRDKLDAGVFLWNYQGHANKFFLAHEEIYRDDTIGRRDVETLDNEGRPFIFLGFACHLAEFDRSDERTREDCLAEKFMNQRQAGLETPGGAVASFASSGYEFLSPNLPFNSYVMESFFYPERSHDGGNLDGGGSTLPPDAAPGYVWTLGESTTRARLMYQADMTTNPNFRQAAQRYVLLGDPALQPNVSKAVLAVELNGQPVEDPEGTFFASLADYPSGLTVSIVASDGRGVTAFRVVDSNEGTVDPSNYTVTTLEETGDGVARVRQLEYAFSLRDNEIYEIAFEAVDEAGEVSAFTIRVDARFAFSEDLEPVVFPHPFPDEMNLIYRTTQAVIDGQLDLYTINGRKIRSMDIAPAPANSQNRIVWDGRDDNGLVVANGTYFVKFTLRGEDGELTRTMPVTKLR